MNDISLQPVLSQTTSQHRQKPVLIGLALVALGLVFTVFTTFQNMTTDDELLIESTVGQFAIWMADQTQNDPEDIISPIAQYAVNWANELGEETLDSKIPLSAMRNGLILETGLILALLAGGSVALFIKPAWSRAVFFIALLILDGMLFIIPTIEGSNTLAVVLFAILTVLAILLISPGKVTRVLGFVVALSVLMGVWEAGKSFADSIDYKIRIPQSSWEYSTYPTLDESLVALEAGEVDYIVADRKDLDDLMLPHPLKEGTDEEFPLGNLRYLGKLDRAEGIAFLPILPEFPGRLSVAVRADEAGQVTAIRDIIGKNVGTVTGEFADEKFLQATRQLVLLDLKILNDLNLPHLQMIAEAFLQPARRNGELLLVRILADAGVYTFSEALLGFVLGAFLGFALGALFAHSALMERGLLPYVVASQTIPILAIAPMVVIWLGANALSVAIIAAYLTFFPVTINTLRGMQSPDPAAIELLHSYAASQWTIMWKLRFPAALPYIFTALKVSATASVVGAIIGELPSGIGDGLGRAILNFSSDYSLTSTPKLWASIVMAATVGILFFVSVSIIERFVLRGYIRTLD
jgi:NitT/TauT family transport system permease protein